MAKKLKSVVSKLDDVDEKYRDLYEKGDDGKYVLSADVGDHPDVANLRSALKRQKEGKGDLEAYRKLGTVDEITERLAEVEDDDEGKPRPKADALQKQVKKLERDLATAQGRVKTLEGGLSTSRAASDVAAAIQKAGGNPKLLTDVVLKQARAIEEDGEWVTIVVDHKGEPRMNGKNERVSLDDIVATLKKDPDFADAFKGSGMSGSGRSTQDTGAPKAEKTIAGNDDAAFLANLDGIASGKVAVSST